MAYLNAPLSQHFVADTLPAAVRAALGKPLRRAAALTQLALVGSLASLPENRRQRPTALLWQSTSGPRAETQALLEEVCVGSGEPMPFDFLAIQPAITAAQIQPFLPGLQSASYIPLATIGQAQWSLLLNLALNWLADGRYAQVLCAHLELTAGVAESHWLTLSQEPLENSPIKLQLSSTTCQNTLADTPNFPQHLTHWLTQPNTNAINLQSPAAYRQALEFTRI
jgi:hypothetical protein